MTPPSLLTPEQKEKLDAFLGGRLIARLATANPKTLQPHVVPVWYLWDGEQVWIHAYAKFRKSREIAMNPRCAVVVDVEIGGEQPFTAVMLEGEAELVYEPRQFVHDQAERIYQRYMQPAEILAPDPQSWLNDPEIGLIKLAPKQVYLR
jgi:nitroimidazol reductase NimA-like FMN-containing flavoprotein (pyridoxamine 5'-phosphate oxidase superfamily)